MFGTTFGYIIAIYPGLSIDYLYNYAKQQQRIQGLSILKDEHTVVKGLSIRKCLFKSRNLHSEVNYVQGKRGSYVIGFFMPTEKMVDEAFGLINAFAAVIWSGKLQSILVSFEELPGINPVYTQYENEDGPGTLMAKKGLLDIGLGF
jgi:hypothetical protein